MLAAQKPASRTFIEGFSGAQTAFAMAGLMLQKPTTVHLFVAAKKDDAAYIFNDLTNLLDEMRVLFFPDSFKRPTFFDELNNTQILQRSETVNKITSKNAPGVVVVTYPEALFEKVVSPEVLEKNRLSIVAGEKLDVDTMMEILVEFGFDRTDFVYEPGQFSLRGGIIDLFSYGNDLPYRIELFDNEVESIRTFDPLTQLSNQKMASVSIIPNLNTKFRQDQKVSFFSVLPADTIIWMTDFQFFADQLQFCFEQAEKFTLRLTAFDTAELREIFRDRAFLFPGDVAADIAEHSLIFLNQRQDLLQKNHPQIFSFG